MARIRSTSGDDIRNGTNRSDTFAASAGDDKINGRGGADTLNGGDGDDEFNGGSGDDTLNGQAGNDKLDGGSGADRLDGGAGDDVLGGGDGTDRFFFNTSTGGDDTILDFQDQRLGVTGPEDVLEIQNVTTAQLIGQFGQFLDGNQTGEVVNGTDAALQFGPTALPGFGSITFENVGPIGVANTPGALEFGVDIVGFA